MSGRPGTLRTTAGACWLSLILICFPALASPSEEVDLPARWQVRADGWSGTLELSVEPSGRIAGTLQDRAVTGFLAGRRLVLRRTMGGHTEVWDGWLPEDPGSSNLFVAGSVTIGDREGGRVHPWYAVPEPDATGDPVVLSPEEGSAEEPADAETKGVPPPGGEARPPTEPSSGDWEGWNVSGAWLTSDGRAEIMQHGRAVSVLLPDGTRHEGRFTASDTFVVGFRRGCCKGKLQNPGQIGWSDGSVWRRVD